MVLAVGSNFPPPRGVDPCMDEAYALGLDPRSVPALRQYWGAARAGDDEARTRIGENLRDFFATYVCERDPPYA